MDYAQLQKAAMDANNEGSPLYLERPLNDPYPENFPPAELIPVPLERGVAVYKLDPHEVLMWLDREGKLDF